MELLERIHEHARRDPDAPAFVEIATGKTVSYGQLSFAVGQTTGDGRVTTVRCRNRIDIAIAILQAWAAKGPVAAFPGTSADAEIRRYEALLVHHRDQLANTPGLLLATSGSTGQEKLIYRNGASLDAVSRNMVNAIGIRPGERMLGAVPLGHSYGIEHGLLAPLWAGATVLLCDGMSGGEMEKAFACGVDVFPAVPSMIEMLSANTLSSNVGRVRAAYCAGGVLPAEVEARFTQQFGVKVGQLYGSTELGSVVYRPGGRGVGVGWPMEGVLIRIGTDDEVWIKAPSMMSLCLGADVTLEDGYFQTGDLGKLREVEGRPCLDIQGRRSLLIDSGGLKINPLEVEAVIREHPGVRECVVLPLRQSETVYRLKAVVVRSAAGDRLTGEELRAWVRTKLAGHKVPRVVEFAEDLPRSATGKVLRHLLESR